MLEVFSSIFSNDFRDFSYWFKDTIIDPEGNVVSDINSGIKKLMPNLYEATKDDNNSSTIFAIPDHMQNIPDFASYQIYGTDILWWFLMYCNSIDNPFKDFTNKFLYYGFDVGFLQACSIDAESNAINAQQKESENKIGTIIELN